MAAAVGAFSAAASAQQTTQTADPVQKQEKLERRGGFGGHKMGGMRGFGGHRRGGAARMLRGFRGLDLTDAQKAQIKSILEANKPDQATMDEMRGLMEARRSGTLTDEQKERFRTLREQARAKGQAVHTQLLAVLTPEQRQRLEQKREEMRERREERRQQRRPGGIKSADVAKPTDN